MVEFVGPPAAAIRNRPITDELKDILRAAALDVGVELIRITSGGQPGTHGKSTGSSRHNDGRAADLQLVVSGSTKTFTDKKGGAIFEGFVTAAAGYGATGIGAGVNYMGNRTIHVGFGKTKSDKTKLVWGAKGKSANAPAWLREAAEAGWDAPKGAPVFSALTDELPARFKVVARSGLKLRGGPGLEFGVKDVLPVGTEVTVASFEGPDNAWANVDLEDDGYLDGHMFASFLRRSTSTAGFAYEAVEEPN